MLYHFTVTYKGREFNCEREVKGKRQTVYVIGWGEKDDPTEYGSIYNPVETMATDAKLIALEIIENK